MKTIGCCLLAFGMFGIALAAGSDPYDVKSLRRQYEYFQSLSPARQQQLRELDRDLNQADPETRDHLRQVMANYNYWLSQLPEEDRRRIIEAETSTGRLGVIREIKTREWIETLPKAYRDKYAKANRLEQLDLLQYWREQERLRRDEWHFVRQNWKDMQEDGPLPIFEQPQFRQHLEAYVHNLESQLSGGDRERLRKARAGIQEGRNYAYLRVVLELSEANTLLPGPLDGPHNFASLPRPVVAVFESRNKKKSLPKELIAAQGRWPDFAIAVTEYAQKHTMTLPEQLGPARKTAMPEDVKRFIEEQLEPTLAKAGQVGKAVKGDRREKADQARRDAARLREAEGKWPDYPRTVMELAKNYKLVIPGWTLPGRPEMWDRIRPKNAKRP